MGDGAGEIGGGAVHIQHRLPGKPGIESGEPHGTKELGEDHGFWHPVLALQKRELIAEILVDAGTGGKDLLPADSKEAVLIPGNGLRGGVDLLREVGGHPIQFRDIHLLGVEAALLLEAVGIVVDAPHQTEPVCHRQHHAQEDQKAAVGRRAAMPFGAVDLHGGYDDMKDHPGPGQDVQDLNHREGHQIAHRGHRVLHGLGHLGDQPVHQILIGSKDQKQGQEEQQHQKPDVELFVA